MTNIKFEATAGGTLDKILQRKLEPVDAVPTPFPSWNSICGEEGGEEGIAKKWLVIIGGVTGTGKSYMALNIAANAVRNGILVGDINFEMTQMAVTTRYLSILTGIPKWQLEMGEHFSRKKWEKAKEMADSIFNSTGGALLSNESSVFTLKHIEQSYRALVEMGVQMIIVDYAQLVMVNGTDGIFGRSEAVATRLRELSHEYNVATLCISQFNRDEAKRNKPPSIHGLMGGGIWEHASSQIWLLNHTLRERYGKLANGRYSGEYTEITCGKNRHGIAPFTLPLKWDYETMRYHEYVPGTDQDDPFYDDQIHGVQTVRPKVDPVGSEASDTRWDQDTVDMFGDDPSA